MSAGLALLGACGGPPGDAEGAAGVDDPAPGAALLQVFDDRPANVPRDYRATPQGYLHAECVIEARPGEQVSVNGDLVSATGVTRLVPPCKHSRFDRAGHEHRPVSLAGSAGAAASSIPTLSGWLAHFAQTVVQVSWQSANFRVPTAPLHQGRNVVFFFNGYETNNGAELIQPVLQWNQGDAPNQWSVAAWYVKLGNYIRTSSVHVNPGDTISGYMYPLGGGSWAIGLNRNNIFATGLSITTAATFNTLVGGAMEVYNVASCEDLPSTGFEFFTSITIYVNGRPFPPTWSSISTLGSNQPNCNVAPFAGTSTGGMTWLYQ